MRSIRGGKIAMIFQEPMTSLNPAMTIARQLSEMMQLHLNMDSQAARAQSIELLNLVGIPDAERRVDDYPHQFSGGMRQRVMVAMAVSCNPKLIIADEPTTALDATIQAQLLELMKDIVVRFKTAMVMVTHNLGIVARYAQRINVMYAGRIVESGTVKEIWDNPLHPLHDQPAPVRAQIGEETGTHRRGSPSSDQYASYLPLFAALPTIRPRIAARSPGLN